MQSFPFSDLWLRSFPQKILVVDILDFVTGNPILLAEVNSLFCLQIQDSVLSPHLLKQTNKQIKLTIK